MPAGLVRYRERGKRARNCREQSQQKGCSQHRAHGRPGASRAPDTRWCSAPLVMSALQGPNQRIPEGTNPHGAYVRFLPSGESKSIGIFPLFVRTKRGLLCLLRENNERWPFSSLLLKSLVST